MDQNIPASQNDSCILAGILNFIQVYRIAKVYGIQLRTYLVYIPVFYHIKLHTFTLNDCMYDCMSSI